MQNLLHGVQSNSAFVVDCRIGNGIGRLRGIDVCRVVEEPVADKVDLSVGNRLPVLVRQCPLGGWSSLNSGSNAPIGLDLGGRSPEETAVSIGAEIIAQRNGRTANSLRNTGGPIHS